MHLRDIMTTDVITIPSNTHIIDAKRIMDSHKLKRLPVVNRGKLVGIVTKPSLDRVVPPEPNPRDLLEFSYNIASLYRMPVKDVMKKDVVTVTPDTTVERAVWLAQKNKVGALVVVEDGQVVGIATTNDFFYKILNRILGIDMPGTRLEIPGGGEGKSLEEIVRCLNEADLNITTLHIYKRRGRAKKNLVIHLDSHEVEQCIAELENKGYKVSVRVRNP